MAEFVMKELAIKDDFYIESRATSSWEHGHPVHRGTQKVLQDHGIPYNHFKTSKQVSLDDISSFDYIVGMDKQNVKDLKAMFPAEFKSKIFLFIEEGVPDPWFTGDFEETYHLVKKGCSLWLEELRNDI